MVQRTGTSCVQDETVVVDLPDQERRKPVAHARKGAGVDGRLSALLYSSCAPVIATTLSRLLAAPPDATLLHDVTLLTVCAPHDRLATAVQRVGVVAASSDVELCRAEYVRLFVRPSGALILPWESTWTEFPPRLAGPAHLDALRFYARSGFQPPPNEPADHISTELAFVAQLAHGGNRKLLAEFWSSHVLAWMPSFARKLKLEAREPLYAAVADLLLASAMPVPSAERQRQLRMR